MFSIPFHPADRRSADPARRGRASGAALALVLLSAAPLTLADEAEESTASARDPSRATPEEVVTKVHSAAKFLHNKGQAGFADFNNSADWIWKDSYVDSMTVEALNEQATQTVQPTRDAP